MEWKDVVVGVRASGGSPRMIISLDGPIRIAKSRLLSRRERNGLEFSGMVGAGVAGVVIMASLTFAALSLSKRRSKPIQQMEPLTAQQETSLQCENDYNEVEENKSEEKSMKPDDGYLESDTGMQNDLSSSSVLHDASSENTGGEASEVLSIDEDRHGREEKVFSDNVQEELQYESAFDDKIVVKKTRGSLDSPDSEIALESNSQIDHNIVNSQPVDSLDAISHNIDRNKQLLGSNVEEIPDPSPISSNSTAVKSPEPLVLTLPVSSELDTVPETHVLVDDRETLSLHSYQENLDASQALHVSIKRNPSFPEVNESKRNETFETTSASAADKSIEHIQDSAIENEINGRTSSPMDISSLSSAGIPAPSVVSEFLKVPPGKVLVPAVVDQVQGQALAALQVLKVIEADVRPSDLCTRREYARWIVSASSCLSRSTVSKVYPAMYIEDVTELAFDDITPDDPDFPSIQGLAEAGLISSKLSNSDMLSSSEDQGPFYFLPESPASRQDLVTWKMALEKKQLPEANKKVLYQQSGFRDIDKINPDAWPALIADLSAGDQGIISLAFGCTRLFQPDKPVTKAQAAVALATGEASEIVNEELARIEAESMAENAVSAHNALVAQVEKDVNASFERELFLEREKINAVEKMAEDAKSELERLRAEREGENAALMRERAAIESEMEILSRLRHEVEEQLQNLTANKVQISYEKERISKLQTEAENERQEISRLQYELEVERKALSMARAWAEDEAKRAREQAKALEEARDRWERQGIKVVVDSDLRDESTAGVTWLTAGQKLSIEGTVSRAENLVDKLKLMADNVRVKSRGVIDRIIQKILLFISILKEWAIRTGLQAKELKDAAVLKASESMQKLNQNTGEISVDIKEKVRGCAEFSSAIMEGARRMAEDCRDGVGKITQKFKP
ncbi:hypothetical protein K2173_026663 [Erythroxylum novogranatense]|uniref:SLH domain-containing protein n=1 Tax=Erythroxylum novogranatense TaxID=1862640 RepID=A0AAV8TWW6_9ROSI|nr:hypothetical protein K2173_026663 [Erythroxylum novogranatense]